jgi:hypothetical protein
MLLALLIRLGLYYRSAHLFYHACGWRCVRERERGFGHDQVLDLPVLWVNSGVEDDWFAGGEPLNKGIRWLVSEMTMTWTFYTKHYVLNKGIFDKSGPKITWAAHMYDFRHLRW